MVEDQAEAEGEEGTEEEKALAEEGTLDDRKSKGVGGLVFRQRLAKLIILHPRLSPFAAG